MTNFSYFQTIIQFRVPIDDNGNAGVPEILKKFTSVYKTSGTKVSKPKQLLLDNKDEEEVTL